MILITNDDGYNSYNLLILYKLCKKIDDEVIVIAPYKNYSNCGALHNLNKKFNIKKINEGYIIDGTPVDCIRFGLSKYNPDLIITGINKGYNLSQNILMYSGTFMGAYEGYKNNIKSLSCSMDKYKPVDKKIILKILKESLHFNFKLANLNIVSEDLKLSNLSKEVFNFYFNDNILTSTFKKNFKENTDADIVLNKKCSSLTIIK